MTHVGYSKVENGGVTSRPRWLGWLDGETGASITDNSVYVASGYYPVYDSPPAFDPRLEQIERNHHDAWQVNADNVEVTYTVTSKGLSTVLAERKAEVNQLRDQGIFSGSVNWTRPSDNTVIPVDMRSQRDRDNLQDLRSAAMVLDGQGITQAVMQFRAADDVVYALTPQDMIAMSQAMMQRGQAWYAAAWTHKDTIKAIADDPAKTALDVVGYDITTGWPGA